MIRSTLLCAVFACVGLGATGAAAQDSYGLRATCPQVQERGPYISAVCYDAALRPVSSRIDVRRCGGAGVANSNGRLTCTGY
jgi:hypothetical protein